MNDEKDQIELVEVEVVEEKEFQPADDKKEIKIRVSKRSLIIAAVIIAVAAVGVLSYLYIYRGLVVAATVDGSPISRLAIIQKLEKDSGKNLLDSLITEKLVKNEVSAKKIVVGDDEISAQLKKVEEQIIAQGGTLDQALAAQGMSQEDLKDRIILQKEMEALLGDKTNVTDQEVEQYIKDNKVSIPKGEEVTIKESIKSELKNQKINTEAQTLIDGLKAKAKINYFVNY